MIKFMDTYECKTCTRKVRRCDGVVKTFPVMRGVESSDKKRSLRCSKCGKNMVFRDRSVGCGGKK